MNAGALGIVERHTPVYAIFLNGFLKVLSFLDPVFGIDYGLLMEETVVSPCIHKTWVPGFFPRADSGGMSGSDLCAVEYSWLYW